MIFYIFIIFTGMVLDSAFADLTMLAEEMVRIRIRIRLRLRLRFGLRESLNATEVK
jgi:hypothetical protein